MLQFLGNHKVLVVHLQASARMPHVVVMSKDLSYAGSVNSETGAYMQVCM